MVCHPDNLPTLTSDLGACSSLRQIVTWGSIPDDVVQRAKEHGMELTTFEEVMVRGEHRRAVRCSIDCLTISLSVCLSVCLSVLQKLGRDHPLDLQPASPKDLSTICYTSGTTGQPCPLSTAAAVLSCDLM